MEAESKTSSDVVGGDDGVEQRLHHDETRAILENQSAKRHRGTRCKERVGHAPDIAIASLMGKRICKN